MKDKNIRESWKIFINNDKYKQYFLSNKEEWNNKSCYQKLTAIEVSGPSCLAPNITGDQSLQVQLSIHKNDQT